MLPIALRMGIMPSYASSDKQSVSELESLLNQEIEEVEQKDEKQFNQNFDWYVQRKDNGSDSKVVLIGDIHSKSKEGYYANLFENTKKFFDSVAIEGAVYRDKNALLSGYESVDIITEGNISFEEYKNNSKLRKQIVNSGKILYGVEDKDLNLAHGCVVGIYKSIQKMIECATKGNLDNVLEYDRQIKRMQNLSPVKLPQYDIQMFENGKFNSYWDNLKKVMTEELVDARSVASANNMADYLKSEEIKQGKGITTGFIYGADHRHKLLEGLNNKGISNIYIGSKEFEKGYDV